MKFCRTYSKFLDILDKIFFKLIGVAMIVMVAVMVYQVFLRYCLGKSNLWSEEVARYLCIYVTFIGSFIAIRRSSHLKVDFFVDLLGPKPKKILMLVTNIAVAFFLVYLTARGFDMVEGGFRNITSGLNIPMAYPYIAIPLGSFLMLLGIIEQILILLFEPQEGGAEK